MSGLRFASDSDLLRYEPNIDQIWPRTDEEGNAKNDWDVQHELAMLEIERVYQARKGTAERFELGRIGKRDQLRLREPAACLALHFIYVAADTQGDADGFFARKAAHYWQRAESMLDAISITLDYDTDNSDVIDPIEKDQPFPTRFIRG